ALRLAAYLSRVRSGDLRQWLSVGDALRMATEGGAALPGLPGIGRIAAGAQADLLVLDLRHIGYVPLRDVPLQVVNGEGGPALESVTCPGRWVLRSGRMLTVDGGALRGRTAAAVERLAAATSSRRE